jgi:5-methylcytosine-specific restriction endonuclease McrA
LTNTAVLVLNRVYQPIHITTAKRAFCMLYQGVARAMDRRYQLYTFESWAQLSAELNDDTIRTVDRVIRIPRVIVLKIYDRIPNSRVRFSRYNIYARDRSTCQYCGRHFRSHELNLDHVLPRSLGGRTTWENVVCSCIECNLKKGGRTPESAGMRLLRRPFRPKWYQVLRMPFSKVPFDDWRPFLSLADSSYWNVELDDSE